MAAAARPARYPLPPFGLACTAAVLLGMVALLWSPALPPVAVLWVGLVAGIGGWFAGARWRWTGAMLAGAAWAWPSSRRSPNGMARAEASEHAKQELHPVDLDQLLHDVVASWVERALARRIDLGYEPAGPVHVLGDAFLLREMINNLLDNALRYTPEEGRVTARVAPQGDFVLLEIEDSGIGISEDEAHKVFDRFYRVEGTGVEGSGLGLAIVREIAELHRAAASLRPHASDETGRRPPGSVARVVFPAYRLPPPPPDIPPHVQTGFA